MLIEFSVSNFRSFREKQTFSMVAAPRLRKRENLIKPAVKGEKLPDLLKVAAIYGPNASGKSSLIKALELVSQIATRQPSAQSEKLPVSSFRFDPELCDKPSRFELHFVHSEQRYQFQLGLTHDRIFEERLLVFPAGKETLLYERLHHPSGDKYTFGQTLEGGGELHNVWKNLTGPQVLFIAQAVANSNENLFQLRNPFEWLKGGLMVISGGMEDLASGIRKLLERFSLFSADISSFLREIDVPVTNIRFEQLESSSSKTGSFRAFHGYLQENKMLLSHKTLLGEAEFDFFEESEGTKNLIGFWWPWSMLYQAGKNNENFGLVIDEFDNSLHPEIVKSLVDRHLKSDTSAQLIFTTHDTHLMDAKLLRRDQFWLTERDANGATQLRSIHDFEGREGEDLEKRYYEGRYRALPIIRRS
ncbi:AAA family ATPase [Methylomonas koyamae]|uniref:ATPase n=1 Tax=Methylomonas koyamae TaxID=702114 RepID=A0A291IGB2_9GAMM|nr:ATP-binding protein [Methylomonas koyamae]ATG89200.1 ATPase [Methylomonas koyamae]OAI24074.1 ATPase [Methylomonas koyamae]